MFPILILAFAAGLFIWYNSQASRLTRTVATTFQEAALAVCSKTPMPSSLAWTIPSFKSTFIESIQPTCNTADASDELTAWAKPTDTDEQATHIATVSSGDRDLISMRVHAVKNGQITVLGWELH